MSGDDDDLASDLPSAVSESSMDRGMLFIVPPPDIFSGDESVTPTPGMEGDMTDGDSQVSTPRLCDPHFTEAMAVATEGKVCEADYRRTLLFLNTLCLSSL